MSIFGFLRERAKEAFQPLLQHPGIGTQEGGVLPAALWFDEQGWLQGDGTWAVEHVPLEHLLWTGMHPVVRDEYGDRFVGIVTHYTALGDGRRTARRFQEHDLARKKGRDHRTVSTHFIVDRDGCIIQLASIQDRTWHAARKGLKFTLPATRGKEAREISNPNHWFVGLDLANWGLLKNRGGRWQTWTGESFHGTVFHGEKGTGWEDYPQVQVDAYTMLNELLTLELGIQKSCQFGHEDIDPGRKIDPGPALHLPEILDRIYMGWPTFGDESPDAKYFNERKGSKDEI